MLRTCAGYKNILVWAKDGNAHSAPVGMCLVDSHNLAQHEGDAIGIFWKGGITTGSRGS